MSISSLLLCGVGGATATANTYSLDLESSSSQYASITDAAQTGLDITGDLTFECYVKLESAPSNDSMWFLAKWLATGNQRGYIFRYRDNAGTKTLDLLVSSDGTAANSETLSVSQTLTPDTWYHIAVTWDASASTAKFYVNGSQSGSDQIGAKTAIFNNTAPFIIGSSSGIATFYDGLISNVRVWNVIRTSTEINDNKNLLLVGNEANLQGNWEFNNTYEDKTANNNDLTSSGSPVFSSTVPF